MSHASRQIALCLPGLEHDPQLNSKDVTSHSMLAGCHLPQMHTSCATVDIRLSDFARQELSGWLSCLSDSACACRCVQGFIVLPDPVHGSIMQRFSLPMLASESCQRH